MAASVRVRVLSVLAAVPLVLGFAAPAGAGSLSVSGSTSTAPPGEMDPDPLPPASEELVEPGGVSAPAEPVVEASPAPELPSSPPNPAPVFPVAGVADLLVEEPPPVEEPPVEEPPVEGPPVPRGVGRVEGAGGLGLAGDAPFPVAVWLPPPGGERDDGAGSVPASVSVQVLSPVQVGALGGLGLAFTVTRSDGVAEPGAVSVDAVYAAFRYAAGGNLASRLRLATLPGCALSTPEAPGCLERTRLGAENLFGSGVLRAVVDAAGDPAAPPGGAGGAVGVLGGYGPLDDPGGQVIVVESGPFGPLGDFSASPILELTRFGGHLDLGCEPMERGPGWDVRRSSRPSSGSPR